MFARYSWLLGPVTGGFPDDELPLTVKLEGAVATVSAPEAEGGDLVLVVDLPVDSAALRLRPAETGPGGSHRESSVDVPDSERAVAVARCVADGVAFITRAALSIRGGGVFPELHADSEADDELLASLGTRRVSVVFDSRGGPWMRLPLVPENISTLASRRSGIRLYADALKMGTSTGKLRELWKVCEAAFAQRDDDLVDSLSRFPAATEMEFTAEELHDLLVLRGRASHAYSRSDFAEIVNVEHEADAVLNRVQGLAEALIVRKKDWGMRTVGVDANSPRYPYVRRDGSIVFFVRPPAEGETDS